MKSADSFLSYILVCYVGAKLSTIDMFDISDTESVPDMFGMSEAGAAFFTEARAKARYSTTSERIKYACTYVTHAKDTSVSSTSVSSK